MKSFQFADATSAGRTDVLFVETTDVSVDSQLKGQLGYLSQHGLRVFVIARDTGLLEDILAHDRIPGRSLPIRREPDPLRDLFALAAIALSIMRLRPAVVVFGTPKASLLAALASSALRIRRRVYIVHGLRAETLSGWRRNLMLLSERLVSWLSTDVVPVGKGLSSRLDSHRIAIGKKHIIGHGSANGVDVEKYWRAGADTNASIRVREVFGIPADAPVVGFVGRINSDKGIDVLVHAMRRVRLEYPNARLLLVGEDESNGRLLPDTKEALTEEWVHTTGFVSDTSAVYASMTVFCLPSRREGLPTVLLEAAAAGVPIVATDATGVRDVIEDGFSGLVVPIDSVKEVELALLRLLSSPAQREALARQAHVSASERFSTSVVWSEYRRFYSDAAGRSQTSPDRAT